MSNISTYFLVLSLIFLASSSRSIARPINVSHKDPAKDCPFSTEEMDVKSSVTRVSIPLSEPVGPYKFEETENGSSLREKEEEDNKQTIKDEKPEVTKFNLKKSLQGSEASAAAVQIKPLATDVSWKLPQKKNGEKQPGFNLDYAPPKTHPPVHN